MFRTIATLALVLFLAGCGTGPDQGRSPSNPEDRIVLDVEGQTLTAERLAPVLEEAEGDSLQVERTVRNAVNRFLILQDARDRGLDDSREFRLYAQEREREKLQGMWFEWLMDRKVVLPPDTVQQFYSQMGEIVIYTAIATDDSLLADSLRQLVLEGADMNDLASRFTSNMLEMSSEGRVGPRDRMYLREDDALLLSDLAPGDVSELGASREGFRFVKLDSVFSDTLPPLSEIRDLIQGRIEGTLRMAIKDELFDSLRTADDFQIVDGMPELIASHFPEGSRQYEPFTPEEEELDAYTFRGGSRSVFQLAENVSSLPPVEGSNPSDPNWIRRYSRLLGLYDIMAMEARQQGMDTLPEVRDYLDQRLSNHLLDIYYDEIIEPRLVPDEEDMRAVYQENMDSLVVPERRIFNVISAIGDDQVELLRATLQRGEDPFVLTDRLTPVTSLLAPDEQIVTREIYRSEIPQPYKDMIFDAQLNETVVCSLTTDRLMVFQPVSIMPSRQATFEESYEEIASMLSSQMEEEVLAGLVDSLASVYHIEIDREFVEGFIHPAPPVQDAP